MTETKKPQAKKSTSKRSTAAKEPIKMPLDRKSKQPTKKQKNTIEIESTREEVEINLVGVKYVAKPPKGFLMLQFSNQIQAVEDDASELLNVIENWLYSTFAEEEAESIMDRLNDPEDDIDLPHIMQLLEKLTELSTGNLST